MKQFIDVQYELKEHKKIIKENKIKKWIKEIFKELNMANSSCSISFVSEEKIKQINKKFLNKDKPTDVLSFSQIEGEKADFINSMFLGDILICIPYAEKNLDESHPSLVEEILFLCIHGILHLMGYDHEKDRDNTMNKKQEEIFYKLYHRLHRLSGDSH